MQLVHVISCGVYREAQKYVQYANFCGMNLTVSGLKKYKRYYPDGTLCNILQPGEQYLSIGYPDFCADFEFGPDRENWVLMFELPELKYDPAAHQLYLQEGSEQIPLRIQLSVSFEEVHELKEKFAQITHYSRSALQSDRLRADFMAASIFQRFLPQNSPSDSPADRLRQCLDQDREHRSSLKEHCRNLEMNPDYLRRAFIAEFGISPGIYRERRQKNDLLSLFTYSNLTFKEIADKLGLKHVQHLNLLTERYFHCTPGELNRRCRKALTKVEPESIGNE